jgi:hypothetical protein
LIFFIVEGERVEVNVLFSASFDMCKEEGKGVRVFFSFDMLKGDGRGKGLNFFYKFIWGG